MSKADLADIGSSDKSAHIRSTLFRLIACGVSWGLCLGFLVVVVPRIESIFKDFGIPLPRNTVFVISAAHRVVRYQWLIAVWLILVNSGAEWFMFVTVSRPGKRDTPRRWSGLIVATPLVLIMLTLIALSLPLFTIMTRLSG